MNYAPAEERAKVKAFVKDDKVKLVSNKYWTNGQDKNIGRTGTIIDITWHGNLKCCMVKADDHRTFMGYADDTFSAYTDELEMVL